MNNCNYLFYQPYQNLSDNFTIIGNATVCYVMPVLYENGKL